MYSVIVDCNIQLPRAKPRARRDSGIRRFRATSATGIRYFTQEVEFYRQVWNADYSEWESHLVYWRYNGGAVYPGGHYVRYKRRSPIKGFYRGDMLV